MSVGQTVGLETEKNSARSLMEYSPVACMRRNSRCCLSDSLSCLPRNFPLGAGDAHALAGSHPDEIGFELGEGGEDIEEHLSHGIARVVERNSEGQFHASFPKPTGAGARIRDGPGQPVEFRHDQRVACAHGGEGLVEAEASRTGEAVIGVDAILYDAQHQALLELGGQILPVGRTARVSDERCRHGGSVRIGSRCKRPAILSSLTGQRKCHHYGDIDIEPERTDKSTDPQ